MTYQFLTPETIEILDRFHVDHEAYVGSSILRLIVMFIGLFVSLSIIVATIVTRQYHKTAKRFPFYTAIVDVTNYVISLYFYLMIAAAGLPLPPRECTIVAVSNTFAAFFCHLYSTCIVIYVWYTIVRRKRFNLGPWDVKVVIFALVNGVVFCVIETSLNMYGM